MNQTWPSLKELREELPLAEGLVLDWLQASDVDSLTRDLAVWYPDIVVGTESVHLDPEFYYRECALGPEPSVEKNLLPMVARRDGRVVFFMNVLRDVRGGTVSVRMGAIDPSERGTGAALLGPLLLQLCGRKMGAGLAYFYATLKAKHQQLVAERTGFTLVGILPAFDLDQVRPGTNRRVYEAVYAKVLANPDEIETPDLEHLTPRTRDLFQKLFN